MRPRTSTRPTLVVVFFLASLVLDAQTLRYSETSTREPWFPYVKQLLEECLVAADPSQNPVLVADSTAMTQQRAFLLLKEGTSLDVYWTMTSADREAGVLPVRFPLLRGLLGQRLIIVRKGDEGRLAGVKTAADLAGFSLGQGIDWPDADILERGGLEIFRSPNYGELMSLLTMKRFDGFPLGANEVWDEIAKRPQLAVTVEPHLVLSYLAPVFFFVAPDRPEVAARIEKGLGILAANGRFVELFNQAFGDDLARDQLSKRTVIRFDNPVLSPATRQALGRWKSLLLVP